MEIRFFMWGPLHFQALKNLNHWYGLMCSPIIIGVWETLLQLLLMEVLTLKVIFTNCLNLLR